MEYGNIVIFNTFNKYDKITIYYILLSKNDGSDQIYFRLLTAYCYSLNGRKEKHSLVI